MRVHPNQLAMSYAYAPRYVVCFSGGHSSALVAIETVRRYGREGVVLLNHDINPRVEQVVAVTGHRYITAEDGATVARVVAEYPACKWVFGGAIGVDTVALRAAREAGLSWLTVIVPGRVDQQPAEAQAAIRDCADVVVEMRGDLSTRGAESAYHARNAAMVAEAEVLAFTDGGPSGTRHCMETAREQARPVRVVGIQGNDWRRR